MGRRAKYQQAVSAEEKEIQQIATEAERRKLLDHLADPQNKEYYSTYTVEEKLCRVAELWKERKKYAHTTKRIVMVLVHYYQFEFFVIHTAPVTGLAEGKEMDFLGLLERGKPGQLWYFRGVIGSDGHIERGIQPQDITVMKAIKEMAKTMRWPHSKKEIEKGPNWPMMCSLEKLIDRTDHWVKVLEALPT